MGADVKEKLDLLGKLCGEWKTFLPQAPLPLRNY